MEFRCHELERPASLLLGLEQERALNYEADGVSWRADPRCPGVVIPVAVNRGVRWLPSFGRWSAQIVVKGTRRALGTFGDEGEASRAYEAARAARRAQGAYAVSKIAVSKRLVQIAR